MSLKMYTQSTLNKYLLEPVLCIGKSLGEGSIYLPANGAQLCPSYLFSFYLYFKNIHTYIKCSQC